MTTTRKPLRLEVRKRRYPLNPDWLGNLESPDSFEVRIARLTQAELDQFRLRGSEIVAGWPRPPEELAKHFAGVLSGPHTRDGHLVVELETGETRTILDEDLEGLLEIADGEPLLQGSLFTELQRLAHLVQNVSRATEGESARRRGGVGITEPTPTPTAAPTAAPEGAGSAGSSSPPSSSAAPSSIT